MRTEETVMHPTSLLRIRRARLRARVILLPLLANHVEHPLSVSLREDAVLGRIDHWLAIARIDDGGEAGRLIAECDRKLAQYRAALEAGANPATVAAWIAETEAEKASCQLSTRRGAASPA
jgi:site-specific DNA recombinase